MPQGWTPVEEPKGWKPVQTAPGRMDAADAAKRYGKTVLSDAGSLAMGVGQLLTSGPTAIATDVARELGVKGALGLVHGSDLAEFATGAPLRQMQQELKDGKYPELAGHATVLAGALLAPKGVRRLRTGGTPALIAESNAGQQLAKVKPGRPIRVLEPTPPAAATSRIPYAAPVEAVTEAAPKPSPNAGGRLVSGGTPASKPPTANVTQAITEGLQQAGEPAFQQQAARRAPRIARVANTPIAPQELPASWRALVNIDAPPAAPEAAPARNVPGVITKRTPKPEAVAAARRALGARDAAPIFGMTEAEVRAAAPGPSKQPYKKLMAELDQDYQRRINDQRGFIDPAVARTLGLAMGGGVAGSLAADDHPLAGALVGALGGAALANPAASLKALQEARMTGMLSGAALPKSFAGNIGAVATAAVENGSLAPIREALRVPTNLRNAARGFANGAQHGAGPIGKANVFGRAMTALDETTANALSRAGLSTPDIQRLLLTEPSPLGQGALAKAAQTPLGQAVMPFQKIPVNTVAQGIKALNELLPGSGASKTRRALTLGAGAAGAAAGDSTDNKLVLGLLAALAGPRAIPFALGAGLTAGPAIIERVAGGLPDASFKDLVDPLRPINKPALWRLVETGGR